MGVGLAYPGRQGALQRPRRSGLTPTRAGVQPVIDPRVGEPWAPWSRPPSRRKSALVLGGRVSSPSRHGMAAQLVSGLTPGGGAQDHSRSSSGWGSGSRAPGCCGRQGTLTIVGRKERRRLERLERLQPRTGLAMPVLEPERPWVLPRESLPTALETTRVVPPPQVRASDVSEETTSSESSAADPLIRLAASRAALRQADLAVVRDVATALESGASWAQIARALGVSKQAAHERYRKTIHARGQ